MCDPHASERVQLKIELRARVRKFQMERTHSSTERKSTSIGIATRNVTQTLASNERGGRKVLTWHAHGVRHQRNICTDTSQHMDEVMPYRMHASGSLQLFL